MDPPLIVSVHGVSVSLPLRNMVLLAVKWIIHLLKMLTGRKYSFENQIGSQRRTFSYRLKLLFSYSASSSHMCLLQSVFRLIFLKVNFSATWKGWLIGSIPFTVELCSLESSDQDTAVSNFEHGILWDTCVSYLQQYRLHIITWMFLPLENAKCRKCSFKFTLVLKGELC
jgi:hypothetical protein